MWSRRPGEPGGAHEGLATDFGIVGDDGDGFDLLLGVIVSFDFRRGTTPAIWP